MCAVIGPILENGTKEIRALMKLTATKNSRRAPKSLCLILTSSSLTQSTSGASSQKAPSLRRANLEIAHVYPKRLNLRVVRAPAWLNRMQIARSCKNITPCSKSKVCRTKKSTWKYKEMLRLAKVQVMMPTEPWQQHFVRVVSMMQALMLRMTWWKRWMLRWRARLTMSHLRRWKPKQSITQLNRGGLSVKSWSLRASKRRWRTIYKAAEKSRVWWV